MADRELTIKEEEFCQQMLITGSQSQAYKLSYNADNMKSTSIYTEAHRLVNTPRIALRIKQLKEEAVERNKITVDECVSLLADLARFDINDLYNEEGGLKPLDEISKAARMSITDIETRQEYEYKEGEKVPSGFIKKLKTGGRESAIDKLLKHLGGYEKDNRQKETVIVLTQDEREAKRAMIFKRENQE